MSAVDRCPLCGDWWAEHKPAGCYARKNVNEWCKCTAPGDGAPRRRKPFPGGVENTVGGFVLFRPDNPLPHVSIDDDLVGYARWWLDASARRGRPIAGRITLIRRLADEIDALNRAGATPDDEMVRATDMTMAQAKARLAEVGDDTPAPTAQWTVHWSGRVPMFVLDGQAHLIEDVLDALNRAGATPDLTALDAVICRYHDGWRDQPQGREIRWVREGYRPDVIRESQPMTAAENAAIRAALVRSAQNDTDGGTDNG